MNEPLTAGLILRCLVDEAEHRGPLTLRSFSFEVPTLDLSEWDLEQNEDDAL